MLKVNPSFFSIGLLFLRSERTGKTCKLLRSIGKRVSEICQQIKDSARNGNRSLNDLVEHIGEDTLVGWAWNPGYGRTPAPGTQKQAGALVAAWVKSGAISP